MPEGQMSSTDFSLWGSISKPGLTAFYRKDDFNV